MRQGYTFCFVLLFEGNQLFYKCLKIHSEPSEWSAAAAAAAAKLLQLCPNLCDPIDGSPPGSAVPGILQARRLEWIAISFSNAWKRKVKVKLLSCAWLFVTPWTAAYQAPPSIHGIFQAGEMEWVAIAFSKKSLRKY